MATSPSSPPAFSTLLLSAAIFLQKSSRQFWDRQKFNRPRLPAFAFGSWSAGQHLARDAFLGVLHRLNVGLLCIQGTKWSCWEAPQLNADSPSASGVGPLQGLAKDCGQFSPFGMEAAVAVATQGSLPGPVAIGHLFPQREAASELWPLSIWKPMRAWESQRSTRAPDLLDAALEQPGIALKRCLPACFLAWPHQAPDGSELWRPRSLPLYGQSGARQLDGEKRQSTARLCWFALVRVAWPVGLGTSCAPRVAN